MDLPPSIKPMKKLAPSHAQVFVSKMIVDFVELTVKINHQAILLTFPRTQKKVELGTNEGSQFTVSGGERGENSQPAAKQCPSASGVPMLVGSELAGEELPQGKQSSSAA